jgi:hypothetical protein
MVPLLFALAGHHSPASRFAHLSLIDEILAIVDLWPPFATQQRGSPRAGSNEFTGRIKVSLALLASPMIEPWTCRCPRAILTFR